MFLYLLHLTTHAGLHLPRPSCWAPAGRSRSLRPQSWLELNWPSPRDPAGGSGSLCPQAATAFPSVGLVVIIAAFGRHADCGVPLGTGCVRLFHRVFRWCFVLWLVAPPVYCLGLVVIAFSLGRRPVSPPSRQWLCVASSCYRWLSLLAAVFRASSLEASSLGRLPSPSASGP